MEGEGDTDYEDIVSNTIDEIKQRVKDSDLDIDRLIEAEKQNKNRKTLLSWLEEYEADADDTDTSPEDEPAVQDTAGDNASLLDRKSSLVAAGVVLGLVVAAVAVSSGFAPGTGGDQTVSAQAAGDRLSTYISNNKAAMRLPPTADMNVQSVSAVQGADMYEATLRLSANVQNQTIEQDVTAYMTADGRYVFFSQPFDTTQPLSDQVPQQQPQPAR